MYELDHILLCNKLEASAQAAYGVVSYLCNSEKGLPISLFLSCLAIKPLAAVIQNDQNVPGVTVRRAQVKNVFLIIFPPQTLATTWAIL